MQWDAVDLVIEVPGVAGRRPGQEGHDEPHHSEHPNRRPPPGLPCGPPRCRAVCGALPSPPSAALRRVDLQAQLVQPTLGRVRWGIARSAYSTAVHNAAAHSTEANSTTAGGPLPARFAARLVAGLVLGVARAHGLRGDQRAA